MGRIFWGTMKIFVWGAMGFIARGAFDERVHVQVLTNGKVKKYQMVFEKREEDENRLRKLQEEIIQLKKRLESTAAAQFNPRQALMELENPLRHSSPKSSQSKNRSKNTESSKKSKSGKSKSKKQPTISEATPGFAFSEESLAEATSDAMPQLQQQERYVAMAEAMEHQQREVMAYAIQREREEAQAAEQRLSSDATTNAYHEEYASNSWPDFEDEEGWQHVKDLPNVADPDLRGYNPLRRDAFVQEEELRREEEEFYRRYHQPRRVEAMEMAEYREVAPPLPKPPAAPTPLGIDEYDEEVEEHQCRKVKSAILAGMRERRASSR